MELHDKIVRIRKRLTKIPQRPDYHPEGNADIHTGIVVARTESFNDPTLYVAAIFHDFGKLDTTEFNENKGYYTSYGHEFASLDYVKNFRDWIEEHGVIYDDVYYLVKNHMRAHLFAAGKVKRPHKIELWESHHMHQRAMILQRADDMLRVWSDNDGEEIIC